jgi:hypothetical protein
MIFPQQTLRKFICKKKHDKNIIYFQVNGCERGIKLFKAEWPNFKGVDMRKSLYELVVGIEMK